MKLRYEFLVNKMGDEYVAIPSGEGIIEFNGIIKLQEKEAYVIELLNKETTLEDLVDATSEKFGIDKAEIKEMVEFMAEELKREELLV